MTPTQILGYALLATPFVALFFLAVHVLDWRTALALFGTLGLLAVFILTGSILAVG